MSDSITKKDLNAQTDQIVGVLNDFMDQVGVRFSEVDERLVRVEENMATKADVEKLMEMIDDFAKKYVDGQAEQAAYDAQWHRLVEWAREVSKKTGVPMPDL